MLVIIAALSIIVFGLIVSNPFIGLYLFSVMLYIKPGVFSPLLITLRPTLLVGVITFVALFFQTRKKGGIKYFDAVQSKWLIALGVVMCLSMITSIWRGNTWGFLVNFFKIYIAYFLIINVLSSYKRYRAIVWAMILSMLYIGVVSIREHYISGSAAVGERMFSAFYGALFGDPNDLALGFTMLIPFLYYDLFWRKGFLKRILNFGILGVFLWGIVLTQSRGGFIGFAVVLLVLWLRSKYKMRLMLIGIVILSMGWQVSPQSFRDRMLSIKTAGQDDAAAIGRMDAWKAGWSMMTHRVFGVGAGNFGEGFVRYRPAGAVEVGGKRLESHNMFIQVGGETGFLGLAIFLLMIGEAFKALNRTKKRMREDGGTEKEGKKQIVLLADATFVSLVGYCASGFFLSQGYNFVLYYLIAFSVVLEHIANHEYGKGKIENGKKLRTQNT